MFKVLKNERLETHVLLFKENELNKEYGDLKENDLFSAKVKQVYNDLDYNNKGNILVGLGNDLNNYDDLRMSGFNLGKLVSMRKITEFSIDLELLKDYGLNAFIEGFIDSLYKFDFYKTKKHEQTLKSVSFINSNINQINQTINLMKGVFKSRDLVNLTPIDLYPESYANDVINEFKNSNVKVEVFGKEEIEKLNMHALLAVSKGSSKSPRFLVLKYFNNNDSNEHITIVGKGVTYDSGGYAIKPAGSMASMKSDMAGSAAVIGLFKALNLNEVKTNVVGVIALTENLISGDAYKNGDVINTMKGLTVEVVNTDAEGRLTLADAIYYAATKLNSIEIIELSTLTGACVVALGNHITGITTENDEMYNNIHKAGLISGEFNWRMPMTKQLKDSVKSDIAELKNAVTGGAGMMTAGIFLNHFNEDVPFMHLDIAGPSYLSSPYNNLPKGATGVKVKTLYNYILNK